MKKPRVTVSDHAVLRYLQRVGGFDVEKLRQAIASRVEAAALAGASGVVVDGMSFRVKDGPDGPVITTVIDASWGGDNHQRSEGRS